MQNWYKSKQDKYLVILRYCCSLQHHWAAYGWMNMQGLKATNDFMWITLLLWAFYSIATDVHLFKMMNQSTRCSPRWLKVLICNLDHMLENTNWPFTGMVDSPVSTIYSFAIPMRYTVTTSGWCWKCSVNSVACQTNTSK